MDANELRALVDALDRLKFRCDGIDDACLVEDAADYLRAQADAQPVAEVNDRYSRDGYNDEISVLLPVGTKLYTHPAPAASQAEPMADSDADYWLRNRQPILDAIERAGFMLMSNASGFWLHPRGTTDAQAEPKREPLSDEQLDAAFRAEPGALLALVSGETTVGAFKTALRRLGRAVERAAYERAAQWVDKRAEDYDAEHGLTDPETGTREYPGNGDEYVIELHEIAAGLRALKELQ